MKLYHGSLVVVDDPNLTKSKTFLDFGPGFYTTASLEQAERWAKIKMKRANARSGYVSVYEFDCEKANMNFDICIFKTADEEWLKFVTSNRLGKKIFKAEDMHIGPIADDNIYQTIRLFESGVLDAENTLRLLKSEILQEQWVFRSEKILRYLKFTEAIKVIVRKK